MFEMNFYVKFLFVSVLSVTSLDTEDALELTEMLGYDPTHLFTKTKRSWNDMSFNTEYHNAGPPNVTYDCSLRYTPEVNIELDDTKHPQNIDSVFIKNCRSLTVRMNTCYRSVKSLQITGAEEVRIWVDSSSNIPLEVVITDVKNLAWTERTSSYYDDIDICHKDIRRNKTSVILKNIVTKEFGLLPFQDTSYSLVSIEDSQFGVLQKRSSLSDAAQIYIVNNTFDTIYPLSFDFRAKESFVFSDNHVKKLLGGGPVISPKVEIVGNTIDYANGSLFKIHFPHPTFNESIVLTSLNISSNRLKESQNNLVELDEFGGPDLITIENNYFNCSCQFTHFLENVVKSQKTPVFNKFLLDDSMNNVCVNFENCPLKKLLGKSTKVCSNTFVCPEDSSNLSDITLGEIASELRILTDALNLFMKRNEKSNCSDQL